MDGKGWAEKVTVVVHSVPETEEYEGGFEAITMSGVPETVTVSAGNRDSKEEAFERLRVHWHPGRPGCDGLGQACALRGRDRMTATHLTLNNPL